LVPEQLFEEPAIGERDHKFSVGYPSFEKKGAVCWPGIFGWFRLNRNAMSKTLIRLRATGSRGSVARSVAGVWGCANAAFIPAPGLWDPLRHCQRHAVVSRRTIRNGTVWRKVQGDWEAWQRRDLSQDDIVRVILDGTVVKVRLDKRATGISVLVALGVRRDGQKVLLGLRNMGGESEAAWRVFLDNLVARKLATPELLIIDGAPGLEAALTSLWPNVPQQRCTVHKHRNLLAHAPKKLHDEVSADYTDMIYARTVKAVEAR
jgi:Transposase, Mutator family